MTRRVSAPRIARRARRRIAILAPALLAAALLGGCAAPGAGGSPAEASGAPRIVVTTNILGDVVSAVVGDEAEVTTLMRPNADPHSFEISAQEAALLSSAELVVSNGLGLEEGLQQHLDGLAGDAGDGGNAGDARLLTAGDVIDPLPYAEGDAAGTPDPHFWTDPARMGDVVDAVAERVAAIDGVDPERIAERAADYRAELAELDAEMTTAFDAIPRDRRALVTNHHVFGYLAARFDFRVVGAVIPGGTTLASPSAADLRELTSAIEQAGVPAIFAESSQPDRLVQVLASEAGIDVDVIELYTESLTAPGEGADTYLTMMRANTQRIADGLGA
ncbi:metal ABC transporter substrate-binding protein [Leucobacter allii]|uniref:Metal ABC transporter substrate-binding protein n=1 Tax=Leucobacter allii TaxID=2932247 RepID=A0ABY4FJW6_9MICO|nr:zinc ABC transporter substrate-binding protein AztC [Leucobacter allii]UOQ56357.1 metal ABC transporter substrate-binding protein [Leucobacter allii]